MTSLEKNKELYEKIMKRKKELKVSYKEMSLNSGVGISTLSTAISNLKVGKNVTTETLKKIGNSLKCDFI